MVQIPSCHANTSTAKPQRLPCTYRQTLTIVGAGYSVHIKCWRQHVQLLLGQTPWRGGYTPAIHRNSIRVSPGFVCSHFVWYESVKKVYQAISSKHNFIIIWITSYNTVLTVNVFGTNQIWSQITLNYSGVTGSKNPDFQQTLTGCSYDDNHHMCI